MEKNLRTIGRWAPLIGGGALLAYAWRRYSQRRSGAKAFRGKWPLPEGARLVEPGKEEDELVEEASRQSFPASDPPSFTPTRVG
jgi:hypothetical protein